MLDFSHGRNLCLLPGVDERAPRKRYPHVQGEDDLAHKLITEKIAQSEVLLPKICWTVLWLFFSILID